MFEDVSYDVSAAAAEEQHRSLLARKRSPTAGSGERVSGDCSAADPWAALEAEVALPPPLAPRARTRPSSSLARSLSPPPRSPLLDLPDELFFHISDYLSTLSLLRLLCRPPATSFRRVLLLHSVFDLDADRDSGAEGSLVAARSLHSQQEQYAPLVALASQFPSLSHLTLNSFGPQLTDATLQPLLHQHGPSLLSLSLAANSLIRPQLKAPNLLSLDLSRCRPLQSPLLHCPQLRELDLSRTYINDLDLARGCEGVQLLRVLRLQSCKNIRSLELPLRHLRILDVSNTAVTDQAVERIARSAPALSVLFVSECSSIRSPDITCASLRVLSLRSCELLRSPTLACPSLTELDMSDTPLSDAALVSALSTTPLLQRLSLRQTYELSTPVLGFDLPQLLSLDLTSSSVQTEGVQSLLVHTPALQSLQVQQCLKVTEGLMATSSVPTCLPDLCDVNLRSTGVSDNDVNSLLHICPALSRLNASMCVSLSALTTMSDSLLHVDLSFSAVTDSTLAVLLSSTMPHLISAVFDHCSSLSSPRLHHATLQQLSFAHCRVLDSLSLDCPALASLSLSGCISLSTTALTPATLSSLRLLEVRSTSQYAVNNLLEQVSTKQVEVRTQVNGFVDNAYRPGRTRPSIPEPAVESDSAGAPSTPRIWQTPPSASRRVARHTRSPSSFAGTSTSPVSAQPSPSTTSTDLSPSPHASPSPLSASCAPPRPQPNHMLHTAPRPIVRRDVRDDDMNHSPSSSSHNQSPSPVKSRYLSFVNSPKQTKSHRSVASASSTTALTFSTTGLHSPITPPSGHNARFSRTMHTVSSQPVTPKSDQGNDSLPPSPALSFSSYSSGVVVPALSASITRSSSAASLQSASNTSGTVAPPSPRPIVPYPFPSLSHLPSASQQSDTSLSTLLQSRPIPRSTLLSTSPVPAACLPNLAQLPVPGRFEARSSSLSTVEAMPRYVLNSVEVYIIQQHIAEIEQRLQAHDDSARLSNSRAGRGAKQQPGGAAVSAAAAASSVATDGALSAAVRYGLKRQLALLKARLKKEERLVEELTRQCADTEAAASEGRARKNST